MFGSLLFFHFVSFGQINNGLIAQYDFSGNAYDASGNNYHGDVFAATLVDDRNGVAQSAYGFGLNKYIEVPNFPVNYNAYSYCAWVKSNTTTNMYKTVVNQLGDFFTGSSISAFGIFVNFENKYSLRHYRTNSVLHEYNCSDTVDNDWHFIVGTYDGDTMKLYKDNILEGFVSNLTTSTSKIDTLCIGFGRTPAEEYGLFFTGYIDDIRIYDRALSACEIEELYSGINPCGVGLEELTKETKELIKVVDLMGRETTPQKNMVLIYLYSDGTTERIVELE